MARQYTAQQQVFLNVLFDEAQGDFVEAKRLAGYSDNTPTRVIVESLKDEITEATRLFLARSGPKAAISLYGALSNPTEMGLKDKLVAARDILDRIGVTKTEKIDLGVSAVFILPPKNAVEDDE
jgi:hypothetical protein